MTDSMNAASCIFCGAPLRHTVVDLGMSPLCESYVTRENLDRMEPFYPLRAVVCEQCFLVQLDAHINPKDIFTEYAYFSSYADSWVEHMRRYADLVVERFQLGAKSFVIEIASNDGYLLQHFIARHIPVLGIEPAENIAKVAREKGIPTLVEFFGVKTANQLVAQEKRADLVAGANVLAQVPDVNDFVEGIRLILKPHGIVTIEFPHLLQLMEQNQFDTIYHEHYTYFSFFTVEKIFAAHGLTIFDVEELPTHGGSLRIYGCHQNDTSRSVTEHVANLRAREIRWGIARISSYAAFSTRVVETKRKLLEFLIRERRKGKSIAGYGAPGKGNTLLNYCGIRTDFIDYTVDRNPYKQGKFLPGTHIPILHPDQMFAGKPDYVLILPWNFKDEIMAQLTGIREWGGKFVVPIPQVTVFP